LAEVIREAFIVAQAGRPGPVLIDIPQDITAHLGEWTPRTQDPGPQGTLFRASPVLSARALRLTERNERQTFTGEDIAAVAAMLGKAKRPLIYAGGGVIISNACGELVQLAERLNAPVAVSLMGIGAMPYNHRLCTGLIGMHGTVASNKAVQKADILLTLGARFSDRVTSRADKFAKAAGVIHFDIDPAEINKNIRTDAWVVGDIKKTLTRVLEKLPQKVATEWNGDIEKWKGQIPRTCHRRDTGNRRKGLHPRFIIEEAARRLGDDTIVVTDVGQHQIWTAQFYPFTRARSFITSGGLGTMGFGLGAALGAKTANPHRPVALFTGDGSFRMNCGELAALNIYHIPILILIFNNRVLGMVRQWQNLFYEERYSETTLDRPPDFVKLADAYGIPGLRAAGETAFKAALDEAMKIIAGGRAAIVEAILDRNEVVLPMVPGGKPLDEQILRE
jgi:acetolactate synthase-1/2/3 large subunit